MANKDLTPKEHLDSRQNNEEVESNQLSDEIESSKQKGQQHHNIDLQGLGVALVTPFTDENQIDYTSLMKILKHVSDGGADYLVIHGTTGESTTTTDEEKSQMINFISENTSLPLVYGLGGNNTDQIISKLKISNWGNSKYILSVCPHYNKPTQVGLLYHYQKIADNSPLPIILYNVPSRTGVNINAETILQLAEHDNIIGVKEANSDLTQTFELARHRPHDFSIISGDDSLTLIRILYGAVGVISVLANALTSHMRQIVHRALEGKFTEAQKISLELIDVDKLMYTEGNPAGIKKLLSAMNLIGDYLRPPLIPGSNDLGKDISNSYRNLFI